MTPLFIHLTIALSSLTLGIVIGWLLRGAVNEESIEKKRGRDFYISLGMVLLALVSLVMITIAIFEYRKDTTCQAEYNKNFTLSITERQSAANDDRTATKSLAQGSIDMLDVILNPASNAEQRKISIEKYREVNKAYVNLSAEAEKKRQENPLPLIPTCATEEQS